MAVAFALEEIGAAGPDEEFGLDDRYLKDSA
jgi:hypothetical protein